MSKIIDGQGIIQGCIDEFVSVVGSTFGPNGSNVMITNEGELPHITKDGVTVAKSLNHNNVEKNAIFDILKRACDKTAKEAGDGPQPLYSKVLTPEGFTTMGELKIGDTICGTNKTTQSVLGIYPKGEKEIYEVALSDGRVVECCENHLWTVTTNNGSVRTLQTKELLDKGLYTEKSNNTKQYKYFIPKTVVDFSKKDLLIDPYLLGLLLGDGSLNDNGSIELSIGYNKSHILDNIVLPKNVSYTVKDYPGKNYLRVKFQGTYLRELLCIYGLTNKNSHDKFIPSDYKYSSENDRKSLLQGLLDTDGHINNRGLFEFSTVSETLWNDFKELAWGLGYSLYNSVKKGENREGSYSSNDQFISVQLKGYKYGNKIVSIKPTHRYTEMMCIKVSNNDHLYITDGYTVTHNTTTTSILIKEIWDNIHEEEGENRFDIIRKVREDRDEIVNKLNEQSIPISNEETLRFIAEISSNGDAEISERVSRLCFNNASVKLSKRDADTTEETEAKGIYIDKGFIREDLRVPKNDYSGGYLYISNNKIDRHGLVRILQVIQNIRDNSTGIIKELPEFNVLLLCDEVQDDALSIIHGNRSRGVNIIPVNAPEFATNRRIMIDDLKNALSMVHPMDLSVVNKNPQDELVCMIEGFTVDRTKTIIKGNFITPEFESEEGLSDNEKRFLRKRKAMLQGSFASIGVGAPTEIEREELYDRYEDTIEACKSALLSGFSPGAGQRYKELGETAKTKTLKIALSKPSEYLENSGVLIIEGETIDPTKVLTEALTNAVDTVCMLFSTSFVLSNSESVW